MGLFDKFKKKKSRDSSEENSPYTRTPNFYADRQGGIFGAVALTQGTNTILPKAPQNQYAVDGKTVSDWKMLLVSTDEAGVIGECDYFTALRKLEKYSSDIDEKHILVKGLTLAELKAICRRE